MYEDYQISDEVTHWDLFVLGGQISLLFMIVYYF